MTNNHCTNSFLATHTYIQQQTLCLFSAPIRYPPNFISVLAGEISQPRTLKIVFKLKREQPQIGNFGLQQGLSLPYLDRAIAITATRLNTH